MNTLRTTHHPFGIVLGVLLVTALALPPAAAANPPIMVGVGTPEGCDDAALRNALVIAQTEGGGTIRFNCGPAPVTISLIALNFDGPSLIIPNNTVIDGGDLVTIEGSPWGGVIIQINRDSNVGLKNLTIVKGGLRMAVVNAGTLTVDRVTFSQLTWAAIQNDGTLFVKNSTFADNGTYLNWVTAIDNGGTASVDHCAFLRNKGGSIGAIQNAGALDIRNSIFSQNSADFGYGAIMNGGTLTIDNTEFSQNGAGYGVGAISSGGSLVVKNSTFSDNGGQYASGAISSGGTFTTIDNCQFLNNHNSIGGAIASSSPLMISNSTFTGNTARKLGGAIFTSNALTITNSTITGNTADIDGGGIYVIGDAPTLIRTTVSGNTPNDVVVVPSTGTVIITMQ